MSEHAFTFRANGPIARQRHDVANEARCSHLYLRRGDASVRADTKHTPENNSSLVRRYFDIHLQIAAIHGFQNAHLI